MKLVLKLGTIGRLDYFNFLNKHKNLDLLSNKHLSKKGGHFCIMLYTDAECKSLITRGISTMQKAIVQEI